MKGNSKKQIKGRMIKKAATMWGVAPNEIEMSFDPIVSLLITACASEMEKISGEIDESQTRVTEKLMQLMTPEIANGATPSHAILYAEPDDDTALLQPEFMFQFKKKFTQNKTDVLFKDLSFSPLQQFKLAEAKITHLAIGNQINELEGNKVWNNIHKDKDTSLTPSTLYIGVSSELKAIPVMDISIYFELLDIDDKELFYYHLRNAKWYMDDKPLDVISGFYNSNAEDEVELSHIFENVTSRTNQLTRKIRAGYKKHYVTLKDASYKKGVKKSKFDELQQIIDANKLKIDEEVRWIKVVFPRIISNSILEKIHCSFNAFPVLNRELNSFTYKVKDYINILPIKTEDLFFDMKSISNTNGEEYKERSKNNSNIDKGTFVMRGDTLGKLDKRQAKEYLTHLIELLKDESASFSFMNNDFLYSNLKGLNQLLALLEKKVTEASSEVVQTNYLSFKPYNENENLLVEYWTTNGDSGNGIPSGSPMAISKGIGVSRNDTVLVTTTHGGRDDLTTKDRLNSYRRSLLSRDRIVTKEDVKVLCYELYGDRIETVNVTKGYANGIGTNTGLVPCIEIGLSPNDKVKTHPEEWETMHNNLNYYLEKKSINVFPYKIKILN